MATYVEIDDPRDPRLADYRDLRDVQLRQSLEAEHGLFIAEGEKVVRRAAEAGYPVRSFLMASALARRAGRRPRQHRRSVLRRVGGPGRAGHRLPRAPRCAGVAGPDAVALRRRGPGGRAHGRGLRGHRRPHQRRGDLPLRRSPGRRRRPARTPVRRPALPTLGEGGDGGRVRAAVVSLAGLVRRAARPRAPRVPHRRPDAGSRCRPDRGGGVRTRQVGPDCRVGRSRFVRSAGNGRPRGAQ